MSMVSAWWDDEKERDAIQRQQEESKRLMGESKQSMEDMYATATTSLEDAEGRFTTGVGDWRRRMGQTMDKSFGEQRTQLDQFQSLQGERYQSTIGDIFKEARRHASGSGLFGGAQEAAMVNPAVQRSTQEYLTNLAGMDVDLSAREGQARMGSEDRLSQFLLGGQQNLAGMQAGLQGQMIGGYGSMAGGAQGNYMQAMGNYSDPDHFGKILDVGTKVAGMFI